MSVQSYANAFGAVDPIIRKHFGLAAKKTKSKQVFSKIFNVGDGDEPVKRAMEWGGPGQLTEKPENSPVGSLEFIQGPEKDWRYAIYAGKMTYSWELARDMKVSALKRISSVLGRSMAITPELLAAQFLGRAFNSSYPATGDGKELCATNHLVIGTSTNDGSNELTTPAALSESSIEDMVTQLKTTKGHDGMITNVMMEKVVVPAALSHVANKLSRTKTQVGTANNTVSTIAGFDIIENPYLDAHSTTRYYALTDWNDKENGLFWEWDVKDQFDEDNSITVLQRVYVAFFRARWGCLDWRAIFGVDAS